MAAPVMNDASSEARNATTEAISEGSALRAIGTWIRLAGSLEISVDIAPWSATLFAVSCVRTMPGSTQLARIPNSAGVLNHALDAGFAADVAGEWMTSSTDFAAAGLERAVPHVGQHDACTFRGEPLRDCETDAARSARHECPSIGQAARSLDVHAHVRSPVYPPVITVASPRLEPAARDTISI